MFGLFSSTPTHSRARTHRGEADHAREECLKMTKVFEDEKEDIQKTLKQLKTYVYRSPPSPPARAPPREVLSIILLSVCSNPILRVHGDDL